MPNGGIERNAAGASEPLIGAGDVSRVGSYHSKITVYNHIR
jgi:hypothetical protein